MELKYDTGEKRAAALDKLQSETLAKLKEAKVATDNMSALRLGSQYAEIVLRISDRDIFGSSVQMYLNIQKDGTRNLKVSISSMGSFDPEDVESRSELFRIGTAHELMENWPKAKEILLNSMQKYSRLIDEMSNEYEENK